MATPTSIFSRCLQIIFYNVFIALALLCLLLIGLEVWLRTDGKFEGLTGADLRASNTIWARYPNSDDTDKHPDLEIPIVLKYDGLAARNHSAADVSTWKSLIAVFGDSFTENRQIDNRYTFDAMINDILGVNKVANFGVNGFGLEQSIQRYLNVRASLDIETVVYLFSANDLRNTYEVSLFNMEKLKSEGVFVNTLGQRASLPEKARQFFVRAVSRLHVTYFILEAENTIRHRFLSKQDQDIYLLAGKLHDEDSESTRAWRRLFQDEYTDDLAQNYLRGNANSDELEIAGQFILMLQLWAEMVRADGAAFIVAPVYGELDRVLLQRLIAGTSLQSMYLDLPRTREIYFLREYSNHFDNDYHWNEMGNLAATYGFLNTVINLESSTVRGHTIRYRDKILAYYSESSNLLPHRTDDTAVFK